MSLSRPLPQIAYRLGNPIKDFQGHDLRITAARTMMMVLWIVGGYQIATLFIDGLAWSQLCNGAAFLAFGSLAYLVQIKMTERQIQRIIVMDGGMVIVRGKGDLSASWDEIERVVYSQQTIRKFGMPVQHVDRLTIVLKCQASVNLDDQGFLQIEDLAKLLKQFINAKLIIQESDFEFPL
jgi:hypothetical protein